MTTTTRIRAVGLLVAGAVAGGVTAASLSAEADDSTQPTKPSTSSSSGATAGTPAAPQPGDGPGRHGGPGGPGGIGRGPDAAALAKELGVTEAKLQKAFDAVREDLREDRPAKPADGTRPTPPTDAQREARQSALAKALAKELGVSEAKVTAALDKVRAAHEAERRDELSTRLDDAVKAGDLTAGDKASVLKAFDAGVLGPRG